MHYVDTNDGDVQRAYCSDSCARTDPDYAGWNGCHENPEAAEYCIACGTLANANPDCGCFTVVVSRFPTDRTEYCDHGNPLQLATIERESI